MKVIFMGTPDFAVGTLEALHEAGHEITLVVSQPDKPKGRGHALQPTPVKAAAELRRTIEERLAPGAAYAELALILFGPFEAQIYRVNEKYRMRMIIKCKMNRRTREFFSDLLQEFSRQCGKKVTITIDINPENL